MYSTIRNPIRSPLWQRWTNAFLALANSLSFHTAKTVSVPLHKEVHVRPESPTQTDLDLAPGGVERVVWQSRWGNMLIEVVDGVSFVNGERVDYLGIPKER